MIMNQKMTLSTSLGDSSSAFLSLLDSTLHLIAEQEKAENEKILKVTQHDESVQELLD